MTGFIYFIRALVSGRTKIGFTTGDPYARLAALQTGNHEELKLFATLIGTERLERRLHDRFAALRENGEWFAPGPELTGFIWGIRAADPNCTQRRRIARQLVDWAHEQARRTRKRVERENNEPLCDEDLRERAKAANALLEAIDHEPFDLPFSKA